MRGNFVKNKKLARNLILMEVIDQKARKAAFKKGVFLNKNIEKIDRVNTKNLKKIVRKYGWPIINLVGKKANRSAWLLVQHADKDLAFQKKCLSLMEKIFKKYPNEIDKKHIAYLKDRVLVNEGKKQLFGTQFYVNKEGIFGPQPIRNKCHLEYRRKAYNLPPLEKFLKAAKSFKFPSAKVEK